MDCGLTVAAMAAIALLALGAALGMLLWPRALLALVDRYLGAVRGRMSGAHGRVRIDALRSAAARRTRDVRMMGLFYLLSARPVIYALGIVLERLGGGGIAGC